MHDRRHLERRESTRRPVAGRLRWSHTGEPLDYGGWLLDASPTDVCFIADAEACLAAGDRLDLRGLGSGAQEVCVTRVATYDARMATVAARRVTS